MMTGTCTANSNIEQQQNIGLSIGLLPQGGVPSKTDKDKRYLRQHGSEQQLYTPQERVVYRGLTVARGASLHVSAGGSPHAPSQGPA